MIDDPNQLAGLVRSLGGEVVPAENFRFNLPLSEVRTVVPKINYVSGLGVRRVGEHQATHPTRGTQQAIVTLELYRPRQEQSSVETTLLTRLMENS